MGLLWALRVQQSPEQCPLPSSGRGDSFYQPGPEPRPSNAGNDLTSKHVSLAPSQVCRRNSHPRSAASSGAVGAGPEAIFVAETHADSCPVTSSPIHETRGLHLQLSTAWLGEGAGAALGLVQSRTVGTGSEDPLDLHVETQTSSRESAAQDRS